MKYLAILILFICFGAKASDELIIWLIAPEIWNAETPELAKSIKNLESYLQQSSGKNTRVVVKTAHGFGLRQYYHLVEQSESLRPDYIFYIQSSRIFAKDFEEMVLSKNLADAPLTRDFFSDEEISLNQPAWSKMLIPNFSFLLPVKKAIFIQKRIDNSWKNETSATDQNEFYLNISFLPLLSIQFVLKDKSRVVFLLSPEKTRYSREIFSDSQLFSSIAQMFFKGPNINRAEIKEYLAYSGLNYQLLSSEFFQLSHAENLLAGSQSVLNSTGIGKSFELIKPVISSYIVMQERRKEDEEKISAEAKKPKSQPKKQKAKAAH